MIKLSEYELITIQRALELALEELSLMEEGATFHDVDSGAVESLEEAINLVKECIDYKERHEDVE